MGYTIDTLLWYGTMAFQRAWGSIVFWRVAAALLGTLVIVVLSRARGRPAGAHADGINHDRHVFKGSMAILDEDTLAVFLKRLECDDSLSLDSLVGLKRFCQFFADPGNSYARRSLQNKGKLLTSRLSTLAVFIERNFADYPVASSLHDVQMCLKPEYNRQRGGRGTMEDTMRYQHLQAMLLQHVSRVQAGYRDYRKEIAVALNI